MGTYNNQYFSCLLIFGAFCCRASQVDILSVSFIKFTLHMRHHKKLVLYDFLVTVKAAPHECVIRTGKPQT